jgi:hypothetical protein
MTYYINQEGIGYKIEYPFSSIINIYLEHGDFQIGASGGLAVELDQPPKFFKDSGGSGGFVPCADFTEDKQGSQVLIHHLGGDIDALRVELAELVRLFSSILL